MRIEEIKIRTAVPSDAAALLSIYAPYVTKTAITFEYVVPSIDEFRGRITHTLRKYPYLVAEAKDEILGYAYAGSFVDRAAYDWSAEATIYIRQDLHRLGLGRLLYDALEAVLRKMNILNVYACIAYPDPEDEFLTKNSVQFHAHLGYSLLGRFHQCGCKFGRWYDMVWMGKRIGEHPENPEPIRSFPDI